VLLSEKVVVITGAGSGVGRASALLFAESGARVVCGDVQPDWNRETVRLIRERGGLAVGRACDVSIEDQVSELIAGAHEEFGRLDVMYNNAGITKRDVLFEDTDEDDWERLLGVNLRGVVYGCKHAVKRFKAQGEGGVIVNTASVSGMVAWGAVAYCVTKAAVIHLTRALAVEVAPFGIRVNCTCPGSIDTNFGRPQAEAFQPRPEGELELLSSFHPTGRVVSPEEVAHVALFLATDMSSNVTGVALPVDGGYVAR